MVLENKMKTFKILFLLIIINSVEAKIVLPELLAKQAVTNIRYLSQDGKFTYYQKRSGSLLFSSNYKVKEMIKGALGTQYTLIGTSARKKIVVMQNENYHNFYSLRSKEKIFITDFGQTSLRPIGNGSSARLHLYDSWVSYYDYYKKIIYFESTLNSAIKFSLKLNNKINPYFNPQIVMSDDNTVYYTDLSENGAPGLIQYKRNTGKSEIIYKAATPMIKAELCIHNDYLIWATFGINFSNEGTNITKAKLPLADFNKQESIYSSSVNDIGQMICDYDKDSITFIKNFGTTESISTDIIELNVDTKAVKNLSEMKTITSVINMDGTLLALDKGKYLIVKGTLDYKNIDSLKALPPSGAAEAIKEIDKNLDEE